MTDTAQENYALIRRVTLVGSLFDGLLAVIKIIIGVIGNSQALIADGVHSLSDLATDVLVIWAARHAKEAPDEKHPYGHERIETLATMVLSAALIAVALGFAYDAIMRLFDPDRLQHPGWPVLIVAAISTLAKEAIYHYTMRAANRINSNMLRANAWHSRSDAASSVIVVFGVIGIMLGFEYADALASLGVAAMIGWIGWTLGREGTEELIDTGVDANTREQIEQTIRAVEGVNDVHQTRTRTMGSKIVMDAHITVDPRLTVSEGHRTGDAVEHALRQRFKELSDITIHIDHEDDALERPAYHLPQRNQVLQDIEKALESSNGQLEEISLDDFSEIRLHYLGGKIELELWRELSPAQINEATRQQERRIARVLEEIDYISGVVFAYRLPPG